MREGVHTSPWERVLGEWVRCEGGREGGSTHQSLLEEWKRVLGEWVRVLGVCAWCV